jgi:hypothetical protein
VVTVIYLAMGAVVFASLVELAAAARRWVGRQVADALNDAEGDL